MLTEIFTFWFIRPPVTAAYPAAGSDPIAVRHMSSAEGYGQQANPSPLLLFFFHRRGLFHRKIYYNNSEIVSIKLSFRLMLEI